MGNRFRPPGKAAIMPAVDKPNAAPVAVRRSRALSSSTIVVWSIALGCIAVAAGTLLWWQLGTGRPEDSVRLDAIRTAASIVIGAGGAAALLLAARRQRYTELDHEQNAHDSAERRVTELYCKAADQLGSDKAPVRLAGVYALERLAQAHPEHRQTIVNLLCAYLRMPFEPPGADGDAEVRQEREVRLAVQEVLSLHLRPLDDTDQPLATFWPDIDLNLTDAKLEWFSLSECRVRAGLFRRAVFHQDAYFRHATFTASSNFQNARFLGLADFRGTTFAPDDRGFRWASFEGKVTFGAAAQEEKPRVKLDNAVARAGEHKKTWPPGWREEPDTERPRWNRLRRSGESEIVPPTKLRMAGSVLDHRPVRTR